MNQEKLLPFETSLSLVVRTYDIDFAGIVSNIVFIRWLEDLRCEILVNHLSIADQLQNGIAPLLIQTKIDYKKSITMTDKPMGTMWISKLKAFKWFVNAEIAIDGIVMATAEQTGCFIDLTTRRPVPVPAELQQKYLEYDQI
ncbi:thioesterase family protein [Gloeocapsopsis sp. IPPAS B-1203]|uniref:acyl-CoA thioesterase n=1 Tax=Gloeocapsopsis sp. IPPAS B-1203 TaxID=2049454 RepID=UPI000C19B03C|nr:thioesterase family protein [Gloeocapsopsis sp. IPPAS B-1203]PIG93175.1 thioesterase [Gloeocapsopsis sp. IPPAS B-1203]